MRLLDLDLVSRFLLFWLVENVDIPVWGVAVRDIETGVIALTKFGDLFNDVLA